MLTGGVNVVDGISQVTKVTVTLTQFVTIPVIGQLDLSTAVTGCGKEYQREATLLVVDTPQFFQSKVLAIKSQRCL